MLEVCQPCAASTLKDSSAALCFLTIIPQREITDQATVILFYVKAFLDLRTFQEQVVSAWENNPIITYIIGYAKTRWLAV